MAPFGQKITDLGSTARTAIQDFQGLLDRRFFSLGFFQTWLFLVFHSSSILPFESSQYSLVYSITIVFALLMLIAGAFLRYHRKSRLVLLCIGTVCGALSTAGFLFLPREDPILFVSSALLGIGVGIFIPFVGKIFSSASLNTAAKQVFLSFAFATLLYFFILGLPEIAGRILTIIVPLALAGVILSLAFFAPMATRRHSNVNEGDEVRKIVRSRPVVVFFIGTCLLGIAFGFSMSFCSLFGSQTFSFANSWAVLLTGLLAVCYFFYMSSAKRSFEFERCFSPVTPIIVIGLLVFTFEHSMSSVLIIAGFQLADMVIWIVFIWIAGHSGLPQRVFCIGKASLYGGMLIGSLAVRIVAANPESSTILLIVASVVAYLLVIASVFIFNNSRVTLAIKAASLDTDLMYITRAIELRCEKLGQKYGLTMREKEVFAYLVQGRSAPYIEEVMFISRSTANSHREHIYTKTNVHSKQELLDLFFDVRRES